MPSSSQASSRVAHGRRKTPMYDEATLKTPPMTAESVPRREFRSRLNGEYKKYSGKVSSEYFVLGRMKPNLDTDELLQKRANKEKVKTFSKNLTALNREIIARMPQATPSASAAPSKFQRAKSYGSSVPRPRPSNSAAGSRNAESIAEELDELQLLEIEHEDRRQQAAKIRRELGL